MRRRYLTDRVLKDTAAKVGGLLWTGPESNSRSGSRASRVSSPADLSRSHRISFWDDALSVTRRAVPFAEEGPCSTCWNRRIHGRWGGTGS